MGIVSGLIFTEPCANNTLMSFLQAVYGSQYYEISKKGRDGAKGRFNGNIFLAVFVILIIITTIAVIITLSPGASQSFERMATGISGGSSGKATGQLLTIPLAAICYLIIANTIGSKKNYDRIIERFNNLPDEEKNKANKKVLVPFFMVLILFFVVLMSSVLDN